jgi:hypothetical protein
MNTPNGHSNGNRFTNGYRKTFDPQIIVEGTLKEGLKSDTITFRLRFLIVDLVIVVTIPEDGQTKAPVYVHFKVDQSQPPGSVEIGNRPRSLESRPQSTETADVDLDDNDLPLPRYR